MPLAPFWFAGWLFITPSPPTATAPLDVTAPPRAERAQQPRHPDHLVYRSHLDIPITAIATGAWIVAEVEKTRLVSVNCKWCDRAPDGSDTLNGLDKWGRRAFLWHHTGRANSLSNITAFVLAPAAAYGFDIMAAAHDGLRFQAVADGILISQSMAIASDVTDIMKFSIGRERPFVHALAPLAQAETPASAENNTSFPSGHTTLAFAVVISSSEIASLRGYTDTSWILRAGLPAAIATAYLRVAADRHYITDVLTGAAVGSAVGFSVPYLMHRRKTDRRIPVVRMVPTPLGGMLAAQWTW